MREMLEDSSLLYTVTVKKGGVQFCWWSWGSAFSTLMDDVLFEEIMAANAEATGQKIRSDLMSHNTSLWPTEISTDSALTEVSQQNYIQLLL